MTIHMYTHAHKYTYNCDVSVQSKNVKTDTGNEIIMERNISIVASLNCQSRAAEKSDNVTSEQTFANVRIYNAH